MDIKEKLERNLLSAVKETLAIVDLDPNLIDKTTVTEQEGIVSTILIKGDLVGKICVYFSHENAAKVVGKMLEMIVELKSPEAFDGIGEVTNMIIGGMKTKLHLEDVNFDISIASSLDGVGLENIINTPREFIYKHFICDEIEFSIVLSYRFNQKVSKEPPKEQPKISAADLLNQLITKNSNSNS